MNSQDYSWLDLLPWLEVAIAVALIGSPLTARMKDPNRAYRWGVVFTGGAFGCSFLAWLAFYRGVPLERIAPWSIQQALFGRRILGLDEINAPMVPAAALLHLLTALTTSRAHMRRFSVSWSLAAEGIRIAAFSCLEPWALIGLLAASTVPPYIELRIRDRPTRVYVIHMAVFLGLMTLGWAAVGASRSTTGVAAWWTVVPIAIAVLVRCGTVPGHCWITDWFEHASMGIALLYVIPLSGVYAAIRLLMPVAPGWMLSALVPVSLATAVYAAGMATVQRETRRFLAHLLISSTSLVMVGLELCTELSLIGALCLWFSTILSMGGFGLTIRALEARFGRLSLGEFHGLYEHSPGLAVFFLLSGLASAGFPATLGFISTEILVEGAVEARPLVGVGVVAAAALNGIAVVRAYFLLFTGARHLSTISLEMGLRDRIAVVTLTGLILGGGLFPQPGVRSRERAAEAILSQRSHPPARSLAHKPNDRVAKVHD